MKIREGFVSNSSSTSFVFVGIELGLVEACERLQFTIGEDESYRDLFDEKMVGSDLDYQVAEEEGTVFLGKCIAELSASFPSRIVCKKPKEFIENSEQQIKDCKKIFKALNWEEKPVILIGTTFL